MQLTLDYSSQWATVIDGHRQTVWPTSDGFDWIILYLCYSHNTSQNMGGKMQSYHPPVVGIKIRWELCTSIKLPRSLKSMKKFTLKLRGQDVLTPTVRRLYLLKFLRSFQYGCQQFHFHNEFFVSEHQERTATKNKYNWISDYDISMKKVVSIIW